MKKQTLTSIPMMITLFLLTTASFAQTSDDDVYVQKLSGPRIGFTFLNSGLVDQYNDFAENDIAPIVSQFGWQFETKFGNSGPVSGVMEFIPLIGGIEQHAFLPSFNMIVGLRSYENWEFGVGPNLGLDGFSVVLAGGYNFHSGGMNIPVNGGIVFGQEGLRFSILAGFNASKRK